MGAWWDKVRTKDELEALYNKRIVESGLGLEPWMRQWLKDNPFRPRLQCYPSPMNKRSAAQRARREREMRLKEHQES